MNSPSSDTRTYEMMRLRLAVSNAIDTWAVLEYELARLLQTVINDENGMVGSAIYYSSTNIETSLRIVDAAIKAAMFNLGYGRAVTACWEAIRKMISGEKDTRNKIVHWHTSEVTINDKGPFFWLIDPAARTKSIRKMELCPPPKGLSADDLQEYDRRLRGLLSDIRAFRDVLADILVLRTDYEELQRFYKKFHQLAEKLKIRAKQDEKIFWPPPPVDMSGTPSK